jgi:hypothetical protein
VAGQRRRDALDRARGAAEARGLAVGGPRGGRLVEVIAVQRAEPLPDRGLVVGRAGAAAQQPAQRALELARGAAAQVERRDAVEDLAA